MKNLFTTLTFLLVLTISVTAQIGRVGINTTTPAAMLHVKDSSVAFTGSVIDTLSLPPISGPGTRMMWYPARAAFRVGKVADFQWDKDYVGSYSFASGLNTIASGDQSFATGMGVEAIGDNSFASGSYTLANGHKSFATGANNIANGENSFVCGAANLANGANSFVTGLFSATQGMNCFAAGLQNYANGENSFAAGSESIAGQQLTTTIGYGLRANTTNLFAIGRFNVITAENPSWSDSDHLFVIGNGDHEDERGNAVTVLKGGNVGITTSEPKTKLHITGGGDANTINPLSGYAVFGSTSGLNLVFDDNEILARNNSMNSTLHLQSFGGDLSLCDGGGKVGIGNSTPSSKLHVTGGIGASYSSSSGYAVFGTTTGANMVFDENEILGRDNGGSSTLYIQGPAGDLSLCNGSGKVGIGNTTPSSKLHVTGGTDLTTYAATGYAVLGGTNGLNLALDNNDILARNNGAAALLSIQNLGGDLSLCDGIGKVGIGNNAPASKLHITGGGEADLTSNGFAVLGPTNAFNMVLDANEIFARNNGNPATLHLQVHGGDLSLCYGSGNVGIGNGFPPASKLNVTGGTDLATYSSPGYMVLGEIDGFNLALDRTSIHARYDSMSSPMYLQPLGGNLHLCSGSGKVTIGGNVSNEKFSVNGNGHFTGTVTANCGVLTCSDIRYKTNIKPIENALQNVKALHGITYDWNKEKFPEKEFNDRHQIGISAQELEKVYPEMVFTDDSGYKTVDYSRLAPVLIEAVKEQQIQIQGQQARMSNLENELKELRKLIEQR